MSEEAPGSGQDTPRRPVCLLLVVTTRPRLPTVGSQSASGVRVEPRAGAGGRGATHPCEPAQGFGRARDRSRRRRTAPGRQRTSGSRCRQLSLVGDRRVDVADRQLIRLGQELGTVAAAIQLGNALRGHTANRWPTERELRIDDDRRRLARRANASDDVVRELDLLQGTPRPRGRGSAPDPSG